VHAREKEQIAREPKVAYKLCSNECSGHRQILVNCSSYSCVQQGLDVPF